MQMTNRRISTKFLSGKFLEFVLHENDPGIVELLHQPVIFWHSSKHNVALFAMYCYTIVAGAACGQLGIFGPMVIGCRLRMHIMSFIAMTLPTTKDPRANYSIQKDKSLADFVEIMTQFLQRFIQWEAGNCLQPIHDWSCCK